ncbi:hypothetical protein Hanom_Chr12g01149601 [Helianthus anomalus]
MSTGAKSATIKKRKSKPKNPPGPNQVFPTGNCTALDAPPGYITLYVDFFREGNFRLPMSKFFGEPEPPKSLHDWKHKFFYIRRGVIPIDMHYRSESEGVPRVNVSIPFADEEWYKTLTRKSTPMIQLEEIALVAAGMSVLWVPQNPRAYLVYAHKGRGYSLKNV